MDNPVNFIVFWGVVLFFAGLVVVLIRVFFRNAQMPDTPSTEIEPPQPAPCPPRISEVDVRSLLGAPTQRVPCLNRRDRLPRGRGKASSRSKAADVAPSSSDSLLTMP